MEPESNILPEALAGLGFGGVLGVAVGYTTKKIGKVVLIGVGLIFILLQFLVYAELITVDWGAVEGAAKDAWETSDGTLADRAWAILKNNLPFGGGFVGGFALGFKMG